MTQMQKKIFLSLLSFSTTVFMCSYAQSSKFHLNNRDDAYYLAKKHRSGNSDSAYLDIEVLEAHKDKHSKPHPDYRISDVWLNDCRHGCDSAGHVKLAVKPGKIELTARSLGLKSISHAVDVKKGERLVIKYYLSYFKDFEQNPKQANKPMNKKEYS